MTGELAHKGNTPNDPLTNMRASVGAGGILASRGLPGLESPLEPQELAGVTDEEVVDALLRCKDESDLRARLQTLPRRPG